MFINKDGKQIQESNKAREEDIVKEIRLIRIQSKFRKHVTIRTAKNNLCRTPSALEGIMLLNSLDKGKDNYSV